MAQRIQREIRVAHYASLEVVRAAMANARTQFGLKTTVDILDGEYPLKEKAPDGYKTSSKIVFDEILPVWNYRAIPAKWGSY